MRVAPRLSTPGREHDGAVRMWLRRDCHVDVHWVADGVEGGGVPTSTSCGGHTLILRVRQITVTAGGQHLHLTV
mgnify:CR=1 FL=1